MDRSAWKSFHCGVANKRTLLRRSYLDFAKFGKFNEAERDRMNEATKNRIYYNFQYAGLTVGAFLILLTPLLWKSWPSTLLIVFLQLPTYFGHQVEEYLDDRFRLDLNGELAQGKEVLTKGAALLVNVVGVWVTDLIALYLANFVRPGLGLIAIYMALVNGTVHTIVSLITRAYNPGLYTAVLLLMPGGAVGLWVFARSGQATISDHIWSFSVALAIHVMIAIHIYRRVQLFKRV